MKKAFVQFWRGLSSLLAAIGNWVATILGMKLNTRYGRFLARVVGTCFALCAVLFTVRMGYRIYMLVTGVRFIPECVLERNLESRPLSPTVTYYGGIFDHGYVKNADGEKTLEGLRWVSPPLGGDSLVCYCKDGKRGYFNKFTGQPVIAATFAHAWAFSEGLAAVSEGGLIRFINSNGKVVLAPNARYIRSNLHFLFHHGISILPDAKGERVGLIDKQGKWVLKPDYDFIYYARGRWVLQKAEETCLLDTALQTVIPALKGRMEVKGDRVVVTLASHVLQYYSLEGELLDDFVVRNISQLLYDSDELMNSSCVAQSDVSNGNSGSTEFEEFVPTKKAARCRSYESETGHFGLMSPEGKIITQPSFTEITAHGPDLYLCRDHTGSGILLNGKGERVR
ncbi:MAG: WG repeat-containing protein [Alloprevotella sp.]